MTDEVCSNMMTLLTNAGNFIIIIGFSVENPILENTSMK